MVCVTGIRRILFTISDKQWCNWRWHSQLVHRSAAADRTTWSKLLNECLIYTHIGVMWYSEWHSRCQMLHVPFYINLNRLQPRSCAILRCINLVNKNIIIMSHRHHNPWVSKAERDQSLPVHMLRHYNYIMEGTLGHPYPIEGVQLSQNKGTSLVTLPKLQTVPFIRHFGFVNAFVCLLMLMTLITRRQHLIFSHFTDGHDSYDNCSDYRHKINLRKFSNDTRRTRCLCDRAGFR